VGRGEGRLMDGTERVLTWLAILGFWSVAIYAIATR
jgi:hypothetical protein